MGLSLLGLLAKIKWSGPKVEPAIASCRTFWARVLLVIRCPHPSGSKRKAAFIGDDSLCGDSTLF